MIKNNKKNNNNNTDENMSKMNINWAIRIFGKYLRKSFKIGNFPK